MLVCVVVRVVVAVVVVDITHSETILPRNDSVQKAQPFETPLLSSGIVRSSHVRRTHQLPQDAGTKRKNERKEQVQ